MSKLLQPAVTRRDFLGGSAAVFGATALPSRSSAQTAKYRRWEISDPNMPPRVLTSYKTAITEMLKRDPADPRNWYRNAFVHLFDCPHGNWWFLPWHRAYLGWFEAICRELSADDQFALPYWDWTKTPRVPAAMFDGVLDPNNSAFIPAFDKFKEKFEAPVATLFTTFSPAQKAVLALRGLNSPADFWAAAAAAPAGMFFEQPEARGLTAANPDLDPFTQVTVSIGTIRSALRAVTFAEGSDPNKPAGFASDIVANHNDATRQGILESQPHNNVHGAMGGAAGFAFMVAFLSPVDPIFFLHHANIDRLWDVWTRRQKALGRPTLPEGAELTAWSNEQFLFFSNEKGQPVTKINAGDYASMDAFYYDYSPGSGEDQVPPTLVAGAAPPPRATMQRFSARITAPSTGGAEPAGGIVEVPAAALQAAPPEANPPVAEVTLNLGHGDAGRRFRVLVSPRSGGSPIEAGAITVFGSHAHGPTTFTVPLPENLGTTAAGAGNVPLDIRVVPLEPPGGASPGVAARRTARAARADTAAPQVTAIQVRTN